MNTNPTAETTTYPAARPTEVTADVVVVGARCAGAATGMLLARSGHDVVIVDRAAAGTDTLSTHGIARTGLVQLRRWGLIDEVIDSGAPQIRDLVFHTADDSTRHRIKDRAGVDFLLAPRRCVLDDIVQRGAADAGARVMHRFTAEGLCRADDGRVTGIYGHHEELIRINASIIVGADGLRSRVARSVGAPLQEERPSTGATHYAYFSGDWSAVEYFSSPGGFAGVFPTHDNQACVWVCTCAEWAEEYRRVGGGVDEAFDAMLLNFAPKLYERTVGQGRSARQGSARGMLRLPNQMRHPVGPGWALVGDAGYHRDAITGHGISDAFRDAELLAQSIDRMLTGQESEMDALASYHHERDRMARDIFDLTVQLAALPPVVEFRRLQKRLATAIEAQAEELVGFPSIPGPVAAVSR